MYLLLAFLLLSKILSLKVVTTSYGKLRGITEYSDDENHKYIFKSVPFVKPPLGELRFSLPENPDPWEPILDASTYSAACLGNLSSRYSQKFVGEDCLYVNIFTSQNCLINKCSVIVYYHGGGFKVDSATMFPDKFILERYVSEDVIFVFPAYRLGALGQLYFGPNDILPENLLMFDAVHALKYVHNEIANFGGDPKRVTIMGHSTGAAMVNALGFSNMVDPDRLLFQQMIVLSAPGEFGFEDLAIESSIVFAERFGCISDRNISNIPAILSCLRKVDANEILRVQSDIIWKDELKFRSFIRGAPFMKLGGKISDLKKNTSPRNMLYGTTEFEFLKMNRNRGPHAAGFFLDFENPEDVINHYYDIIKNHTDWVELDSCGVFVSARTYCESMVNAGADVYIFETRQKPLSIHPTDMQYFIGIHREDNHTTDMDILDSFYSKMLVNFTKTGFPFPEWPKLDLDKMNYLEMKVDTELGEGPKMLERYHDKEMEIWFGEMMEYDKNVTKTKQARELQQAIYDISRFQANSTSATKSTSTLNQELNEPAFSSESQTLNSGLSLFLKWWFYLVVVFVLLIVVLVIITLKRSNVKKDEERPLLG